MPWSGTPDPSTPRLGSPLLYDSVGIYSGVPPDLVLPSGGSQSGATRLAGGVFRSLRPDSARFPKEDFIKEDGDRPSTAPAAREVAGKVAASQGPPQGTGHYPPEFGREVRGDEDRPHTAPAKGARRKPPALPAEGEFEGVLEGDEEEDGVTTFQSRQLDDEDGRQAYREHVPSKTYRNLSFEKWASSPKAVALRRVPWRPEVFLALKQEALGGREDPMLRTLLQRLVQFSTKKALDQESYFVHASSSVKEDIGETVTLWPHIGRCDVCWYGDTKPRTSFEMKPSAKEASPDAVVSSHSVVDTVIHLRSVCPEHPVILVAEVIDFDGNGDVDQRNACSVVPDDLLLRSDLGRFLDQIKRSCRQLNQKDDRPNSRLRDYMTDKVCPYVARLNEVTIFRGPAEKGYPFLKETLQVTVLLMAVPRQRAALQQVYYQTKPPVDWYEQLAEYQALVSRFFLLARAIEDLTKQQAHKAVVVMPMIGCASNVQQPHDAIANCLKHWKQNYSHMMEALHICCRNRRGPDNVLTARVRAAVNLRERPAPGLDAHHRNTKMKAKPRITLDRAVLDDPLDEDETDEAVAQFREISERAVEFGTDRRGSIQWTSKTLVDFMRKRKELHEVQKSQDSGPNTRRTMALAMANLFHSMKKKDADPFGLINAEDSSEEDTDQGGSSAASAVSAADAAVESPPSCKNIAMYRSKSEAVAVHRRQSLPDLGEARADSPTASTSFKEQVRRASTTCVRGEKEHQEVLEKMPEKVREMEEMHKLARQTIQAKAVGKALTDQNRRAVTTFDVRRRSSLSAQLGAGQDLHIFRGEVTSPSVSQELGQQMTSTESDEKRPASPQRKNPKVMVTNASLKVRSETRNRLLTPSKERPDSAKKQKESLTDAAQIHTPSKSAVVLRRAQRQAEALKVKQKEAESIAVPSRAGRVALRFQTGASFALPVPPDRPIASLHTQFRRRNMRENIMIYRARCEDDLTQADLLDIELATAECEGEIIQIGEQFYAKSSNR